jgi:hypothetical protein
MTYSAPEDVGPICHVHSLAICNEIGERLCAKLARDPGVLPPFLVTLMTRLGDEPDTGVR